MAVFSATRFRVLGSLFLVALALAFSVASRAQDYPKARPIHLVVPFPAGGATDVLGRLVGQELGRVLGQVVIVENKAGAAGSIGTDQVAQSAPDGYTICFCTTGPQVIQPHLTKQTFDPRKDLVPVIHVHDVPNVLVARTTLAANTVPELVRLARSKPGEISYGTTGQAGPQHLAGEYFQKLAGIRLNHVPYKGENPAFTDLMAGHVDLAFGSIAVAEPLIRAGKIKPIAVTGKHRSPSLGGVPTVAEQGYPDYEAYTFVGLNVPAGTPGPVIDKLNRATNEVLADQRVREKMLAMAVERVGGTSKAYAAFLAAEYEKMGRLIEEGQIVLKE
jgi:tripartite-type tricarboxylate transporter receptor subunit TctC